MSAAVASSHILQVTSVLDAAAAEQEETFKAYSDQHFDWLQEILPEIETKLKQEFAV